MKPILLAIAPVVAVLLWLALGRSPRTVVAPELRRPVTPELSPDGALAPLEHEAPAEPPQGEIRETAHEEPAIKAPTSGRSGELFVIGKVRDAEGTGVVGARVFVLDSLNGHWITNAPVEFGNGLTAAEGAFRIPCPELATRSAVVLRSKRLLIYAERAGYSRAVRLWKKWPRLGEPLANVEVDLLLEPGRWVHGRLLAADGFPVAGAHVKLLWRSPGEDGHWESWPPADAAGLFRLPFPPQGEVHQLWARAWQEGVALVDLRDRDDGAGDLNLGDVVLNPLGTLSGQVVLLDGSPARGVLLVAVPVELRGSAAIQTGGHSHFNEPPEDGPGLPQGRGRSDAEGRFRIAGLEPGPYVVYPQPRGGTRKREGWQHVDSWFPTGSRDVLVVVDTCRLVVELVDGEGHVLSGVEVTRAEVRLGDDGKLAVIGRYAAKTAADGTADFEVEPGASYVLNARVQRVGSATAEIEVPPNAVQFHHRLVLTIDEPER